MAVGSVPAMVVALVVEVVVQAPLVALLRQAYPRSSADRLLRHENQLGRFVLVLLGPRRAEEMSGSSVLGKGTGLDPACVLRLRCGVDNSVVVVFDLHN